MTTLEGTLSGRVLALIFVPGTGQPQTRKDSCVVDESDGTSGDGRW